MKNIISAEICKECGECCKHFPFVDLSEKDIASLEKLTALPSELFAHKKEQAVEEYFLQFKENGDCFFLDEHKGSYSCGVYQARPAICKKYPSEPLQKKKCQANMGKTRRNQGARKRPHLSAAVQFFRNFLTMVHLLPFAKFFHKGGKGV